MSAYTGQLFISCGGGTNVVNLDAALNLTSTLFVDANTINVNAPILATSISGTATTVNVLGTARIPDAISLGTAGATINVPAGILYPEAVNLGTDTMYSDQRRGHRRNSLQGSAGSLVQLNGATLTVGDATSTEFDGVIQGSEWAVDQARHRHPDFDRR